MVYWSAYTSKRRGISCFDNVEALEPLVFQHHLFKNADLLLDRSSAGSIVALRRSIVLDPWATDSALSL